MGVCFLPVCYFGHIHSSTQVFTGLGISLHLYMPNAGPDPESLLRGFLQAILNIFPSQLFPADGSSVVYTVADHGLSSSDCKHTTSIGSSTNRIYKRFLCWDHD